MTRRDRQDVIDLANEILAIDGLRKGTRAKAASGRRYMVLAAFDADHPLMLVR